VAKLKNRLTVANPLRAGQFHVQFDAADGEKYASAMHEMNGSWPPCRSLIYARQAVHCGAKMLLIFWNSVFASNTPTRGYRAALSSICGIAPCHDGEFKRQTKVEDGS
jgi:hypothetical protein